MKNWTREFALRYMTSHDDEFYLEKLRHRFEMFEVKKVCRKHFGAFKNIESVCDIGAGVMGGALALFPYGKDRVIVDLLINEFGNIGKLPEGLWSFDKDFSDTELQENSMGVVFSWEVLDHALNDDHFIQGQKELIRILKPGGLLFFYLPLRSKPKPAHVVIRTEEQILEEFKELELISKQIELNYQRYEKGIYLVYKKNTLD